MRVLAIDGRRKDVTRKNLLRTVIRSIDSGVKDQSVDGIPVSRVSGVDTNKKLMFFLYGWWVARYCREQPPQLLHSLVATPWSLPGMLAVRAAGIPILYTETMVSSTKLPGFKKQFYNLSYKPVSCVVVSSGVMRRRLRERGVGTPIEIIPNGVDLERFCPPAGEKEMLELRRRLGISVGNDVVLFVGGALKARKGVDVLAKAWARLAQRRPNLSIILLGKSGPAAFFEGVRRELLPFEKEGRVKYPGMVDNVEEYMKAADLFVFPSRREGMPNVVAEAFACGLPSILTPFEGLPEEFGKAGREFVMVDWDAREMAVSMERFLDSPSMREDFGRRAREWVEENLSVEESLDRYAALYRRLACE